MKNPIHELPGEELLAYLEQRRVPSVWYGGKLTGRRFSEMYNLTLQQANRVLLRLYKQGVLSRRTIEGEYVYEYELRLPDPARE